VKQERAHRASRNVVILIVLCVGAFLLHIRLRTFVVTTGYEVGSLRQQIADLDKRIGRTNLERRRLMGPDALLQEVETFKNQGVLFVPPKTSQLIYTDSTTKESLK
jgi:hypothetical protein